MEQCPCSGKDDGDNPEYEPEPSIDRVPSFRLGIKLCLHLFMDEVKTLPPAWIFRINIISLTLDGNQLLLTEPEKVQDKCP